MILIILFILYYASKWFFKALFFTGGAVCTCIGMYNLITYTVGLIKGVPIPLTPFYMLISMFNIGIGVLFFYLVFYRFVNKKVQ